MKTTISRELLGVVLDLNLEAKNHKSLPFSAHVVVNQLRLDEEGNICLSAPGDLQETLDRIDALKSELDQLANECVLRTAHDIAFGQARAKFVLHMGGGSVSSLSDEVPGQSRTSSLLAFRRPAKITK